jgi:hypothetical protein
MRADDVIDVVVTYPPSGIGMIQIVNVIKEKTEGTPLFIPGTTGNKYLDLQVLWWSQPHLLTTLLTLYTPLYTLLTHYIPHSYTLLTHYTPLYLLPYYYIPL